MTAKAVDAANAAKKVESVIECYVFKIQFDYSS